MLNLVVLSLGIVASKADLSCNGFSFENGGTDIWIPAGVCMAVISESHKSSSQYVCKGGKIHGVFYASSSNCTGDFTEYEVCSTTHLTNCTSVCDQDPCEYIKEVSYSGVTSCDPIVVSSSTNVGYHITGQCRPSAHPYFNSTSMLCDSSAGARYVMYTSDDCTGDPTLSTNLITTCNADIDNDYALAYSCGTANGVQITHTPETTIEGTANGVQITHTPGTTIEEGTTNGVQITHTPGTTIEEGTANGVQITHTPETTIEEEDFGNPGDVSSFGIFVVMVFVVGMLSWM